MWGQGRKPVKVCKKKKKPTSQPLLPRHSVLEALPCTIHLVVPDNCVYLCSAVSSAHRTSASKPSNVYWLLLSRCTRFHPLWPVFAKQVALEYTLAWNVLKQFQMVSQTPGICFHRCLRESMTIQSQLWHASLHFCAYKHTWSFLGAKTHLTSLPPLHSV